MLKLWFFGKIGKTGRQLLKTRYFILIISNVNQIWFLLIGHRLRNFLPKSYRFCIRSLH